MLVATRRRIAGNRYEHGQPAELAWDDKRWHVLLDVPTRIGAHGFDMRETVEVREILHVLG